MAVKPARVDMFVGLDSDDRSLQGSFGVVGGPTVLSGDERSFLSAAILAPEEARGEFA